MMKSIIYQLLPRTFTNFNEHCVSDGTKEQNGCGKFNLITDACLQSLADMGVTHIWYTGVLRHATAEYNHPFITKGKAGSPYAITDFYDVDIDLAVNPQKRMQEFEALVKRTHDRGMKVGIDCVPNHVSREYKSLCKPSTVEDLGKHDNPDWAFSPLNNFYYIPNEKFSPEFPIGDYEEYPAKVTGNDCFTAHPNKNDWYETVKLNYGVFYTNRFEKQFDPIPSTWEKMRDIVLFWCRKKVDFFRVDMAELVPVEFWRWVIPQIKDRYPKIEFIAECYDVNNYRPLLSAGFTYLYDKVGMYDCLRDIITKSRAASDITHCWLGFDDIKSSLLYFLENHDEQRIASGFFCGNGAYAKPAMIVMATLWNNPLLIYAGQEVGEKGMEMEGYSGMDGKTSIFDYCGIKSIQAWANKGKFDGANLTEEQKELRRFYQQLFSIAQNTPSIINGKLYDIEYCQQAPFNCNRQYAFLRQNESEVVLVVVNFDDKEVTVPIQVPSEALTYFGIMPQERVSGVNLLTGERLHDLSLVPDMPFNVQLNAWDGVIVKMEIGAKE